MTQIDIAPAPSLGSVRCTPAPSWAKHGLYAVPPDATADRYIDEGVCRLLQDT